MSELSVNWILLLLFTLISIILCFVQIVLRKKVNFLSLCKLSIFLPLVFTLVNSMNSMSQAFVAISRANDLTGPVLYEGLARFFNSLNLALIITVILAICYAVSKSVYINHKNSPV